MSDETMSDEKTLTSKDDGKAILDTASRLYNMTTDEEPSLKIRKDKEGKIARKEIFLSSWNREFAQEHDGAILVKANGEPADTKQAINRAITDSVKQLCSVMLVHGASLAKMEAQVTLIKSRMITVVDDPSFGSTDFVDNERALQDYIDSITG